MATKAILISRFIGPLGILLFCCCNKNNNDAPTSQNHIYATITPVSGSPLIIDAVGDNAIFLDGGILPGVGLQAKNDAHAQLDFIIGDTPNPGVYPFILTYEVNSTSPTAPVYDNNPTYVSNPGSVNITAVSDHHIEGSFNATCKIGLGSPDSVIINGTFKGDYKP